MKRMLVRAALFLGSGAVALVVAWLVLGPGFRLSLRGFVTAVVVFSVAQVAVSPLADKLTRRYAASLIGGVGLISTFVALLVATLLSGGLQIIGVSTWIAATVIVWLVTALAAMAVPHLFRRYLGDPAGVEKGSTGTEKGRAGAGSAR